MGNKHTLTDDQIRQIWTAGFNSASSILNDALLDLLAHAYYRVEDLTYVIPQENISLIRSKLSKGYFNQMRIGSKAGLDYYFAMTKPASELIPEQPRREPAEKE